MKSAITKYLGSRPSKKEIVYNVLKTSDGWQIQAFLPSRISPQDRITIIDWFHGYRTQVQNQHPLWITQFRFSEQAYFLDITPASTPAQMIAHVVDVSQSWQHMDLEYA